MKGIRPQERGESLQWPGGGNSREKVGNEVEEHG